ncbi:phospholipase effector Tle1 domain-containing protein [Zoogloea sp.]|uniref:phospholipase effector Tle1 domain-containing protein n=1 Tax=Zoogloea sp. TaxID=49181 RepID=UPI0035B3B4FF
MNTLLSAPRGTKALVAGVMLLAHAAGAAAYECEMDVTERPPAGSPRAARDLFVFLDGTGNSADSRTNVRRLHERLLAHRKDGFAAAYIPGVGSTTNPIFGNALGHGLERRVRCGYAFLAEQYQPGDRIFIFGFSRGAHEARNLAGLIAYAGVPPKEDSRRRQLKLANGIQEIVKDETDDAHATAWAHWKPGTAPPMAPKIDQRLGRKVRDAEVTFLGVWDTVPGSAFVKYGVCKEMPNRKEGDRYKTGSYPPIHHIAHAVSLDEKRSRFHPLLLCPAYDAQLTKLEQEWFPGAHADVGGGYTGETGLPDISLGWMIDRLATYGVDAGPAPAGNPRALAHWSIGDAPANAGSTCEERERPADDTLSPTVDTRGAGGAVPLRVRGKVLTRAYPVRCADLEKR